MVAAEQSPRLVTAHGSFEAYCPCRGVSRDNAAPKCHRGGWAKFGEQLPVTFCEDDVTDGAIRERCVIEGVHRVLHPEVRAVDGPERYRHQEGLGAEYLFRRKCIGDIAATYWCHRLHKLKGRTDGVHKNRERWVADTQHKTKREKLVSQELTVPTHARTGNGLSRGGLSQNGYGNTVEVVKSHTVRARN